MLQQALQKYFGYESFREGQQEVIEHILAGQDVIALLPTGMGKSLCYQLPGYLLSGPVLIVSPLLSLMQDQVDQVKKMGEKRVVALNSFLTPQDKRYALHYLNEYRFIFASPEMLMQEQVLGRLREIQLSLIVVDEAHCLSQWGFDFRPDYLRLKEMITQTNRPPILALTATATPNVLQEIETYLAMQHPYRFLHTVNRPNIYLAKRLFERKEEKIDWILNEAQLDVFPGIIYTQSRAKTEQISDELLQKGVRASAYHGGMELQDRQFIQQQFLLGHLDWIVATNAFGMGIHKSNIRQVIHESMPSTIANYMQEIGRAGRDGKEALATLLYAKGDEQYASYIVTEDLPKSMHIEQYEKYKGKLLSPKQMVDEQAISETAFRVLHYWMGQESASAVENRLHQMEKMKLADVQEMLLVVKSQDCMRLRLVQYFGQQLSEKAPNCCENCGLDVSQILLSQHEKQTPTKLLHWQERLKAILLAE